MKKLFRIFFLNLIFYLALVSCCSELLSCYSEKNIASIKDAIDKILNIADPIHIGIKIISLDHDQCLYKKNSSQLFIPASLNKLFTAAIALQQLGKDFCFITEILTDENSNESITGNLYMKGSGDPSLKIKDLDEFAISLRNSGIKKVNGNLVIDSSIFDDKYWAPGWMWDQEPAYFNSPISGLSVNHNCIQIKVSCEKSPKILIELNPKTEYVKVNNSATIFDENHNALIITRRWLTRENVIDISGNIPKDNEGKTYTFTVDQPDLYTGTLFKEILEHYNISIEGEILKDVCSIKAICVAQHKSSPLIEIIKFMLKNSDNLYAESLLKKVASKIFKQPGSNGNGTKVMQNFIAENLKLDTSKLCLADGSGMSRYNLVSPNQLIALLMWINEQELANDLIDGLPIAGIDGTLKKRMKKSSTESNVKAKTGTMKGVSSLCGYLKTKDGDNIAFVIITNNFTKQPDYYKTEIEDKICTYLCEFTK